jgi:hypothetical protein
MRKFIGAASRLALAGVENILTLRDLEVVGGVWIAGESAQFCEQAFQFLAAGIGGIPVGSAGWKIQIVSIQFELDQEIQFHFVQQTLPDTSIKKVTQQGVLFERLFGRGSEELHIHFEGNAMDGSFTVGPFKHPSFDGS